MDKAGADWGKIIQTITLVVLIIGLGGVIAALNFFAGNKDNLGDIQKSLGIISGVSASIVLVLAIFLYIYVRTNPQAFVPLAFLMLFLNFELSIIATSVAVLQRVN